MSSIFERISNRLFGMARPNIGKSMPTTQSGRVMILTSVQQNLQPFAIEVKQKKRVRINENNNEVIVFEDITNFMQINHNKEIIRSRMRKMQLRSVEKKPYVPPVGTILQEISRHGMICAVMVLPDHRLIEVQRGMIIGMHLYPRFIFNTPHEWKCWLDVM